MRIILVGFLLGALCAALPAQNSSNPRPAGDRYAYWIQYVPKNDFYKAATFKKRAESYDSVSRYLQARLSRLIEARGFHPTNTADSAVFKFTIDLIKVWDNQGAVSGLKSSLNPLSSHEPVVTVQAAISVSDSAATLIYRKEFAGKGKMRAEVESAVTVAARAADDLVVKVDNDVDLKKVLYVPSGAIAENPAPMTPASQEAATTPAEAPTHAAAPSPTVGSSQAPTAPPQPHLVQLPANTAVTLMLDRDFDSSRANEGDIISFTLAEDLRVGADTVVKAGVKAKGSFYWGALTKFESRYAGALPPGKPHIRMEYLEIGDLRVNLFSEQAESKKKSLAPGAKVLGPVHEKNHGWILLVDKGTQFQAYTAENASLPSDIPATRR